jgi:hypothetical protein
LVAGKQLRAVDFVGQPVQQTGQTTVSNSFDILYVPESLVADVAKCVVAPDNNVACVKKHVRFVQVCPGCGKKHGGDGATCKRCLNHSFEHVACVLDVPQMSCSVVGPVDIPPVLDTVVEVVPLSVFTRAGRRGHYEQCGLITLFNGTDV